LSNRGTRCKLRHADQRKLLLPERREKYMTSMRSLALVVLCSGAALLNAAETPPTALLVLAKTDQTLSIVNPATLTIAGQVPAGPDPHEVIASADGKFAYISNYGRGLYNTITVVDLVNQKASSVIDLGPLRGPHGLAFVGGKLWFTAEAAKAIGSYDPATKTIDWILGTGQDRTHMINVSSDLNRVVTTNVNSATVSLIEKSNGPGMTDGPAGPAGAPLTSWTETVIAVGEGAEGFDVSPGGKEIWVANAHEGTISIIDMASKKVVQTLEANLRGANRLKFTPDGKLVFVSAVSGPDLAVIDAATRKDVKRIRIGRGAAGILMQPDGVRAYVACSPDNYVVVIDLKTLEITGKIATGKRPDGLAWAVRK
jgi:YVTN family beta-propeller protein